MRLPRRPSLSPRDGRLQPLFVGHLRNELRRGVFLLLLPSSRKIIVWSGRAASQHHQDFAASIAARWKSETPRELGSLNISSVETLCEGQESGEFWSAVKGSSADYQRMAAVDLSLTASPQLYHMTSVLGSFEVNLVKSEYRKAGLVNNLMVDQALLYEAEQPGNSTLLHSSISLYTILLIQL